MTNSITISHFDFSDVPDQNKAIELDIRFDYAKQKAESGLIEMGQALAEQKTVLPHGCWIKWLESKDISANTAQRLIQISEKFSNTAHGPHLGFGIMRLLAQDTVPESARQEALEKSEAGEKLSIKSTKELIEAHKRIDDLETELARTQAQIPTEDIKAKIKDLEKKLEAEKQKPPQSVEVYVDKLPDDYQKIKDEKDNLAYQCLEMKSKIQQLKSSIETEADEIVKKKLKEMEEDLHQKQYRASLMQNRIDDLQPVLAKLEKRAGDIADFKEMAKKIFHSLNEMSIAFGDYFHEHDVIPATEMETARHILHEIESGIEGFRNVMNGGGNEPRINAV